MSDVFYGVRPNPLGHYNKITVVTPSDTVDLDYTSCSIYTSDGGNITVDTQAGDTVLLTALPAGTMLPIRVTRVYATGTTATNIYALTSVE